MTSTKDKIMGIDQNFRGNPPNFPYVDDDDDVDDDDVDDDVVDDDVVDDDDVDDDDVDDDDVVDDDVDDDVVDDDDDVDDVVDDDDVDDGDDDVVVDVDVDDDVFHSFCPPILVAIWRAIRPFLETHLHETCLIGAQRKSLAESADICSYSVKSVESVSPGTASASAHSDILWFLCRAPGECCNHLFTKLATSDM